MRRPLLLLQYLSYLSAVASETSTRQFRRSLQNETPLPEIFPQDTGNDSGTKNKKPKILFGTENGYDVGGSEPLCWDAVYSTENSTAKSDFGNGIERLNEEFFTLTDSANLMPSCFLGTNFSVTPLNLEAGNVMMMEKPYTFSLELEVDLKSINQRIQVRDYDGEVEVHFRIHLCDALQGFCNPVVDYRTKDAALTRADTDVVEDESEIEEFTDDEDKWLYSPNTTLIGLSDDDSNLKVYSRWCKWTLFQEESSSVFKNSIDITLQVPRPENTALGKLPFFFLGHAVLGFDLGNDRVQRVDISEATERKIVYLKAPPHLLTVSITAKAVLGTGVALVSTFALVCLCVIIARLDHPVMSLAQGRFLAVMAFSCLVQSVFTYTYIPGKDVNCNLKGPLVLIPVTLTFSVLVARVWRVYSTLSKANTLGRQQTSAQPRLENLFVGFLDVASRALSCFGLLSKDSDSKSSGKRRNSMRRVVTEQESISLLVLLTFPQVVLQVVGTVVVPSELVEDYNEVGSLGRIVCSDDNMGIFLSGTGYATFVCILAVLMAWISRDLPSAFNEKDGIFHAAAISAVVNGMAIGVGTIVAAPTTEPDVDVLLWGFSSLVVSGSVLLMIIWPKVSRIFSGETVVVSKMLGSRYAAKSSSSGMDPSETGENHHHQSPLASSENTAVPRNRIVLGPSDPMPSSIESKMLGVQRLLKNVLKQSGDGRALSQEDWNQVRSEVEKLKDRIDSVDVEA